MKKNKSLTIPNYAGKALDILLSQGFTAFFVGGCVRDFLLNRTPKDWDIATNALPLEIAHCFYQYTTIRIGESHGTIAVIIDNFQIEITTFRTDGAYSDNRHPDSVRFTDDILLDLSRRDFTVNAIALSASGKLIDPFLGAEDIKSKTLKTVGVPMNRFKEDSLRIMRGLRFASTHNFTIEPETLSAIKSLAPTVRYCSAERLYSELQKIILGDNADAAMRLAPEVFSHVFTPSTVLNLNSSLNSLPKKIGLRLACLLFYAATPNEILKALKVDKLTTKSTLTFINHAKKPLPTNPVDFKGLLAKLGFSDFIDLTLLIDELNSNTNAMEARKLAKKIKDDPLTLNDLNIDGRDLLALGFKPGKEVGAALNLLLYKVLSEELPNSRDSLISHLKATYPIFFA